MFMLQLNHSMSAEGDIISPVFDVYIIDSALNQYLLMLGEFHMDGFQDHSNLILCYLIFLASTFITQITFLNMLVAIMGDTFERVISQRPTFSLKNKLDLMGDMKPIIEVISPKKKIDEQGHYLYVIMRQYDVEDLNEDDDNWQGKMLHQQNFIKS